MNICLNEYIIGSNSTLNKDVKNFGKQHMFDDGEGCWNSDNGSPQSIVVGFKERVIVEGIELSFQGGFVGTPMIVQSFENGEWKDCEKFYMDDSNAKQSVKFKEKVECEKLRIVFEASTDLFGRVTIYNLKFIGSKIN
ncbi:nuclear receptor 2C2-associated protein [Rozella allomycis CSF55]|uniref:Nuclear receptor 2C2-associated protein n=1 Tax=Rozella allomycis (strain CSF55) TaxID=988480 RepID=A0A075AVQ7_ROZAC|nr:hypothetical protein O9G_000877 [Rozella allomycis CSF55]RKP20869.1 nuclear receptor 2C2-associated protein [Rozella allomycis CSF55]|eukprot:EPZ32802.1 hypothetical protein O9G_000877 [Rozella allomycis CSF55]